MCRQNTHTVFIQSEQGMRNTSHFVMHNFINIFKIVSILGGHVRSKHVAQLILNNCQSLVVTDSYFTSFQVPEIITC